MKIEGFILGLQEELGVVSPITPTTILKNLDNWDSMAAMLLIGYVYDVFEVNLNADDLSKIDTIYSLIERIGVDRFN